MNDRYPVEYTVFDDPSDPGPQECEKSTPGCSVLHSYEGEESCQPW